MTTVTVIQRHVWVCSECSQKGVIQPGHFQCEFPKPWDGLKQNPSDPEEPREYTITVELASEKTKRALLSLGYRLE